MKLRRNRTVVSIFVLLLSALGIFSFSRHEEPRYRGKTITRWVDLQFVTRFSPTSLPDARETSRLCDEAVLHLGTNCIPYLLQMLQKKDSYLKLRAVAFINARFPKAHLRRDFDYHQIAMDDFQLLKKDTESAVPALVKLAKSKDRDLRFNAFEILIIMNQKKSFLFPIMLEVFDDPDPEIAATGAFEIFNNYADEAARLGIKESRPGIYNFRTNSIKVL